MAISKFWLDVFREMVGVDGVLVAFQLLSTIKKGTSHSNFQLNEPFSKFLRQILRYEVPCSKEKKNNTLCQYRSYIWLDVFGGMMDVGGGLVALQSVLTIKRALATPISNRMSPFRSFYDKSFDTKCLGMEKKIK